MEAFITEREPFAFTVSDANFAPRTVAMIDSFRSFDSETPILWVVTDLITEEMHNFSEILNFQIESISDILSEDTLEFIRSSRSFIEQMWTYPSVVMEQLFQRDSTFTDLVYLDADIYFFENPRYVWDEIPMGNIGLVEHKFSPRLEQVFNKSGRFNVSWVSIPNTRIGRICAAGWAADCLEICPAIPQYRNGNLIYGDQGYLELWPKRFSGRLKVINHLGVGVAPWNFEQYAIVESEGKVFIDGVPLVFYHFSSHQFGFFLARKMGTSYSAIAKYPKIIYKPYERSLKQNANLLGLKRWKSRYRPFYKRVLSKINS